MKINIGRRETNNYFRAYGVYIDGVKVGELRNNQRQTFDVSDDFHEVCLKIDWCGSNTIQVEKTADEIELVVVGRAVFGSFLHIFWKTNEYLKLEQI